MDVGKISVSHALPHVIKLINRTHYTTTDVCLKPEIKNYIVGFLKGFRPMSNHPLRIESSINGSVTVRRLRAHCQLGHSRPAYPHRGSRRRVYVMS